MNVEEMQRLKTQTEAEIQNFISSRVGAFNRVSGLLVVDVEVRIQVFTSMSGAKQVVFAGTTLDVHIPALRKSPHECNVDKI